MMCAVWTRRIADEFWSGPVTPLSYSLFGETMAEHMVRRTLRQAGIEALANSPVLRLHASHVYVNGTLLVAVVNLLPPVLRTEGLIQLLPAPLRAALEPTSAVAATVRTATTVLRFLLREPAWSPWQRAAAFDHACAAIRTRFSAPAASTHDVATAALYEEMGALRAALGTYLETVSWGVVFAYVFYHLVQELCRRWAPGLDAERAALTVGLPGVASLDAAREVNALGAVLASDPNLLAAARAVPRDAADVVIAANGPAAAALRAILARHGHRLTGRDLACPTWREAPRVVLGLAMRAAEAAPYATALATAEQRRHVATARIEQVIGGGLAGAVRVPAFRAALAAAQRYYVVRENMRYYADFFLARLRGLALALGARLVDEGRLAAASDVCLLDFAELGRALVEPTSRATRIAERRAALARDTASPPPVVLGGTPDLDTGVLPGAAPALVLTGECAAPGRCRGRARLVHGPADFGTFAHGDVMVAAYTDPGWTPVLEFACGLVLDAGGQLSHGAIVARELGIPALVNVEGATRTIHDGDELDVDATAGVVRILRG
jgi:pyruvate,water dikinase